MIDNEKLNNLSKLSDSDKKLIIDKILSTANFKIKDYIFNEIIESLGIVSAKNYSEIMNINIRKVYRQKIKKYKIDSILLIPMNQ